MSLKVDISHLYKFWISVYVIIILSGLMFVFPFGVIFMILFGFPISLFITKIYASFVISDGGKKYNDGFSER